MRLLLPLVLLIGLWASMAALDPSQPDAELTTGYISIETLDPQMMRAAYDIRIAYGMFEGLCTYDPQTFTVIPGVAERWDVSDDGMQYTFHLRANAKWSDGKPVTTHDFITAWRLALMPDTGPPYAEFLHAIKGAGDFSEWCSQSLRDITEAPAERRREMAEQRVIDSVATFERMVGVKAVDERTLVVKLEKYLPYFLDMVASWPYFPVPAHVILDATAVQPNTWMYQRDANWIKPDQLVCNGPYVLSHWRFKGELVLTANPEYHAADSVKSKTVRLVWFSDELAMFNAYESGVLDVMFGAGPLDFCAELIEARQTGKRRDVHSFGAYGTYYYSFNCRPKLLTGDTNPFADVRVRRAFAMVIDKRALTEEVTRLRQPVTSVFIPPGSIQGYPSPIGVPALSDADSQADRDARIVEARNLLSEAGYPGGRGMPTIDMTHNTGGGHDLVAQAMMAMWQKHLNVRVNIDKQEWRIYLDRRRTGQFMVARAGWFGDYGDPTTFLDLFATDNGNNDTGHTDAKYDQMLTDAAIERDTTKRLALLADAERYLLHDRVPILPLYQYMIVHLFDPEKVSGVSTHPRNLQMFQHIQVKR